MQGAMSALRRARLGRAVSVVVGSFVSLGFLSTVQAAELNTVDAKKFGYSIKIPSDFKLQDKITATTSWIREPGAASPGAETKKKKGLGAKISVGGVSIGGSTNEEASSTGGGSSGEGALMVYVNWTHMPNVSSKQMFDINKKSLQEQIDGPNATYTDLKVLEIKDGYAFWYKEVNKDSADEIHRWHIQAYGNTSAYTIGLTGTYGQFEQWGKVYEEVVKGFKLIPLEQ